MSEKAFKYFTYIFLTMIMLIIAYPLYFVVIASFSDPFEVFAGNTFFWVSQPTLEGYRRVFEEPSILRGYQNTILYTTIGTFVSTLLVLITAYPLSRKLPGKRIIMIFFVITMFFSGGLIPTFLVVQNLGLINSMWALILPGGVSVFNVIVARNFFETSISNEMYEAAEIDGSSELLTFIKIVIPLSKPIIAVMVVFAMVAYWNDWFTALIYLPDRDMAPLQLVLRTVLVRGQATITGDLVGGFVERQRITELIRFASIIVSTVPMLVVFPFVQKYFEKGLMAGAIKG